MNAVAVIEKSLQGGGTPTATGDFTVTTDHPLVTLITMIAPSPDWFVGVHGESLLDAGGQWRTSHSVDCASIWIAPQRMRTSFAFEMATMPPKVSGVDYSVSWDGDYFSDGFGGGTPRNPSSRRSSRISAMTSAKFSRTSSGVLPWPLAPGISGAAEPLKICGELLHFVPRRVGATAAGRGAEEAGALSFEGYFCK